MSNPNKTVELAETLAVPNPRQTLGCEHTDTAARVGTDISWWQCTKCGRLARRTW
jgi:ribosomal protein L37AE/L43A